MEGLSEVALGSILLRLACFSDLCEDYENENNLMHMGNTPDYRKLKAAIYGFLDKKKDLVDENEHKISITLGGVDVDILKDQNGKPIRSEFLIHKKTGNPVVRDTVDGVFEVDPLTMRKIGVRI